MDDLRDAANLAVTAWPTRRIEKSAPRTRKDRTMQRTLLMVTGVIALIGLTAVCEAQQPEEFSDTNEKMFSEMAGDGEVTPEMWFYMQEYRRYLSPKEAVRRKAEARSQQRQNRLAAQRWFGVSNLRPTASPVPQYGTYSPMWVGNTWNPYFWTGTGQPVVYHVAR